jgi:integrase
MARVWIRKQLRPTSTSIPEFIKITGRVNAKDVDDMDLRRYMAALEKRGLSHRTICNYYTSVASFLFYCGVDHKTLLPRSERPVPQDGEPESYTEEEIEKFFAVMKNDRDRLFFEFLLKTGAREREATYAEWTDILHDSQSFRIQPSKPELGFRTKTGKGRTIPLEDELYGKLKLWRELNPGKRFIFGTRSDKPNGHFLEACKELAVKAGYDDSKFWLYKCRSTFATWALRRGVDIRTVQGWMGHSKIEMTERYPAKGTGEYAQAKMNAAFRSTKQHEEVAA